MRRVFSVPALGAAMVVLTVGAAPLLALAADHLDAPNLGSIHVDPSDNLSVSTMSTCSRARRQTIPSWR